MTEWEGGMSAGTSPGPIWVSAADAADKAGTTPGRVREWAHDGVIASQPSSGPLGEQVLVRLDEVVDRARRDREPRPVSDHPAPSFGYAPGAELSPILKTIPELVAQLTAATDRAARAETKVEFLNRQVNDLRRRLAEVPDALPDMALEQGSPVDAPAESAAEETTSASPNTFFHDDGPAEPDRSQNTEAESPGGSLAGIWADDAPEKAAESEPGPPDAAPADVEVESGRSRTTDHPRDIPTAAPKRRRRWWRRA